MSGRRVHERYERRIPVTILHEGREHDGVTQNVSLGGMYLETKAQIPFGAAVKIRVRLPALKEDSVIAVTVRWVKADGIGVQFGSLRALEVWALNQLFKHPR